ncbi:hypothetical protein EJ04DRAFT_591744 [Polyplosphaeria fusca]|uniref:Uncharacterized protein n=1 Tax=Polyplosphaeria fusca TaxID=682080 RepID=A0A9P4V2K3_9PLEO|nr:hypothetical protein EJ04DRAFT_591744 [Polyplosphaeria fusca]
MVPGLIHLEREEDGLSDGPRLDIPARAPTPAQTMGGPRWSGSGKQRSTCGTTTKVPKPQLLQRVISTADAGSGMPGHAVRIARRAATLKGADFPSREDPRRQVLISLLGTGSIHPALGRVDELEAGRVVLCVERGSPCCGNCSFLLARVGGHVVVWWATCHALDNVAEGAAGGAVGIHPTWPAAYMAAVTARRRRGVFQKASASDVGYRPRSRCRGGERGDSKPTWLQGLAACACADRPAFCTGHVEILDRRTEAKPWRHAAIRRRGVQRPRRAGRGRGGRGGATVVSSAGSNVVDGDGVCGGGGGGGHGVESRRKQGGESSLMAGSAAAAMAERRLAGGACRRARLGSLSSPSTPAAAALGSFGGASRLPRLASLLPSHAHTPTTHDYNAHTAQHPRIALLWRHNGRGSR